jgi:hypothetical protein
MLCNSKTWDFLDKYIVLYVFTHRWAGITSIHSRF